MEFCNIKEIKKIFKYDKYRMSKENIIKKYKYFKRFIF